MTEQTDQLPPHSQPTNGYKKYPSHDNEHSGPNSQPNNHYNENQYGAKDSHNNRQYQSKGGRYGSNKYSNRNNSQGNSQYYNNRYNNSYRLNNNDYNAAMMPNMQWPANYYAPQMYYIPQQMVPVTSPPYTHQPLNTNTTEPPSAPKTTKIEITTKTGERLNLKKFHEEKKASKNDESNDETERKSKSSTPFEKEATPAVVANQPTKETSPEAAIEKSVSEAENTKRLFLEQVRMRKAAMERKKNGLASGNEQKLDNVNSSKIDATKSNPFLQPETVKDEPKPVEEEPKPVEEEPKPIEEEPKLIEEEPKPVEEEPKPVEEEPKPVEEEPKPVEEADEPVLDVKTVASEIAPQQDRTGSTTKTVTFNEPESKSSSQDTTELVEENKDDVSDANDSETVNKTDTIDEGNVNPEIAKSENADIPAEETTSSISGIEIPTVSQLLETLKNAEPISNIYDFSYPADIEKPDIKYKKPSVKYTYGPTFLLQFKDRLKVKADPAWVEAVSSKIVIPPHMARNRPKDGGRFGGDFRSPSTRNLDPSSNSRMSSKRRSKRMGDDRKSNRGYTSRRDREKAYERAEEQAPKENVVPLVPSANRWVPKSRVKKTEKKLAPDGKTELLDNEEVERKMKSLLNKLTLEMFDSISTEILDIANQSKWEDDGETLKIVIEQIFHKACDEPHWSSMYAQLCGKVVKDLDVSIEDKENEGKNGPKLVLHYLVARCHEEFEKGWADKLPAGEDGNPLEPELMSDDYYIAAAAKRRGLGLVRFIGYLYCLNLLTGKMMFECFRRLMKDLNNDPSEETLESVIELLDTVGKQFENDKFVTPQATLEGSVLLDNLFLLLQHIIKEGSVSNRIKFKLIDVKELREIKHWNSAKKDAGPKTIQQIHQEDEQLRQMKNSQRTNSRFNNHHNQSNSNRFSSNRRNMQNAPRDNFASSKTTSFRNNQKQSRKAEESSQAPKANMFDALMNNDGDSE
ncbi:translation initiation factor eIF4G [Saccharomyces eubayanus]|uniref:translation initiation factor eIF4G n=1 Tax=Saccharomyces eubayanus TaxID=1080349 RepID=UPI0006BFF8CD|nr:TIF4632-like protein [Saccharomyces eubayanus]KOG99461.1 TIF4632-like protein [Saccharomyces eubayanus]